MMQRCGMTEVFTSLKENEDIRLVLVKRGAKNEQLAKILAIVRDRGIRIIRGSDNDMWRMSRDNSKGVPEILALVGRDPTLDLDESIEAGGLIWLLAGATYPVNIGFCIRTAEVSGADAVIVDAELSNTERKAAKRASMKAHRVIPVHWGDGLQAVKKAKKSGFRIISVEDTGTKSPWKTDLTGNIVLIVGGEKKGISKDILEYSDEIIRIPMTGFVPSFNLQAPLSAVAVEAQRQRNSQNRGPE